MVVTILVQLDRRAVGQDISELRDRDVAGVRSVRCGRAAGGRPIRVAHGAPGLGLAVDAAGAVGASPDQVLDERRPALLGCLAHRVAAARGHHDHNDDRDVHGQEQGDIEQLDEKQDDPDLLEVGEEREASNHQHEEADQQQVHGGGTNRASVAPVEPAHDHEHQAHEEVDAEADLRGAARGAVRAWGATRGALGGQRRLVRRGSEWCALT